MKRGLAYKKGIKIITLKYNNISKTTKTANINLFKTLCEDLDISPNNLNFNSEEIYQEYLIARGRGSPPQS